MELRDIANTGIQVSPLGLGTVKLGRNQGIKYPQGFELPDDAAVRNLLALAQDLGINLLDTAPAYGLSEERLGRLLGGKREDWVIETKVGENFKNGISSFDFSAKGTYKSIENSLRLLKTDYLDMVLIHSDGEDDAILRHEAVLATLFHLKEKGLIRAVGISSKTAQGGTLAFELGCDVVMATHNPVYTEELAVLKKADELKRAVLIKKAFVSGHLNKLSAENPIEKALRFIFAEQGVTSVILGTINPQHLQENSDIAAQILSEL